MLSPQAPGELGGHPRQVFASRPVIATALLLALGVAVQRVPGLERARIFTAPEGEAAADVAQLVADDQKLGESTLATESHFREELALPEQIRVPERKGPIAAKQDDFKIPAIDAEQPPVPLIDPESLSQFYASLAKTAIKRDGQITRIVYHGDSLVASDYVTATLRRKLQTQFGDAGHGFMLVANAWPAYFHNDVFRFASRGWVVSRVVGPYLKDGLYGLGGVSFKAAPGVRARFGTAEKGSYGRHVSRFRIAYLSQPHGGDLKLSVDGKLVETISTRADAKTSGFHDVVVSDGEHQLEILTAGGMTRVFGVAMERDQAGVVLDAIGIQGARVRFLDKQDDTHWAQQLAWRDPKLIVYQFGANESGDGFAYSMEDYHRTMKEVLLQAKAAVPGADCLVLGAMDRARKEKDWMITVPVIPLIVDEQEKTAHEVGCAFWNTFDAMGGKGSMAKWVRRGLGQADLTHPTSVGAEIIGNWVYQALISGYESYRNAAAPKRAPGTP